MFSVEMQLRGENRMWDTNWVERTLPKLFYFGLPMAVDEFSWGIVLGDWGFAVFAVKLTEGHVIIGGILIFQSILTVGTPPPPLPFH